MMIAYALIGIFVVTVLFAMALCHVARRGDDQMEDEFAALLDGKKTKR